MGKRIIPSKYAVFFLRLGLLDTNGLDARQNQRQRKIPVVPKKLIHSVLFHLEKFRQIQNGLRQCIIHQSESVATFDLE